MKLNENSKKLLPWVAGAGMAASQVVLGSSCSVPREGRCSSCGSCLVALGALVAWAVLKKGGNADLYREPPR